MGARPRARRCRHRRPPSLQPPISLCEGGKGGGLGPAGPTIVSECPPPTRLSKSGLGGGRWEIYNSLQCFRSFALLPFCGTTEWLDSLCLTPSFVWTWSRQEWAALLRSPSTAGPHLTRGVRKTILPRPTDTDAHLMGHERPAAGACFDQSSIARTQAVDMSIASLMGLATSFVECGGGCCVAEFSVQALPRRPWESSWEADKEALSRTGPGAVGNPSCVRPRPRRLALCDESMRGGITTRLCSLASWLSLHRAVNEGGATCRLAPGH